jgi:hypothetical protein
MLKVGVDKTWFEVGIVLKAFPVGLSMMLVKGKPQRYLLEGAMEVGVPKASSGVPR